MDREGLWRMRDHGRKGQGSPLSWGARHVSDTILDTLSSVIMLHPTPHGAEIKCQVLSKLQNHKQISTCFCFKPLSFGMIRYAAKAKLKNTFPHFVLWFYIKCSNFTSSAQILKDRTTLMNDNGCMQREKQQRKKTAELGYSVSLKLKQVIYPLWACFLSVKYQ